MSWDSSVVCLVREGQTTEYTILRKTPTEILCTSYACRKEKQCDHRDLLLAERLGDASLDQHLKELWNKGIKTQGYHHLNT